MMPNITRGDRPGGLIAYLQGPGRHNEHVEPHLVAGSGSIMAWHSDGVLDRQSALEVGRQLDRPHQVHGTEVKRGHVWHCSLSLAAEEGVISEDKWAAIAEDFVNDLGFTESSGASPCRWVAVHHGQSEKGNDHIHIAVNLVREDGTAARVWGDYAKAQEISTKLERKYGLAVLESREAGYSLRGVTPAEQEAYKTKASTRGAAETVRATVERRVRGHAAASQDEAEFVRRCRRGGLLVRPRFASGRDDVVVGYSAAVRPSKEERTAGERRPYYFGGGRLGRDLTLSRLRDQWTTSAVSADAGDGGSASSTSATPGAETTSVPDTPAAAETSAAAVAEWRAAHRGQPIVDRAGRETQVVDPKVWNQCHRQLTEAHARMQKLAVGDTVGFAHIAHDSAGVLAAWSMKVEGARPGPLASASRELSRYAQLRAHQMPVQRVPQPGMRQAAQLILHATNSDRGSYAVLLRQLAKTVEAVRDHHQAAARLQAARAIEGSVATELAAVREKLPRVPKRISDAIDAASIAGAGEASREDLAAALATVSRGEPGARLPGSPLPPDRRNPLEQHGQPAAPASTPGAGSRPTPVPGQRMSPGAPRPERLGPGHGPGHGV